MNKESPQLIDASYFKFLSLIISLIINLFISLGLWSCDDEPSEPNAASCTLTSDCDPHEVCFNGLCLERDTLEELAEPRCALDQECREGEYCDPDTERCYTSECANMSDCELGHVCERGRCLIDVNADQDRDGVPDAVDNCELEINPHQSDLDRDGIGDLCDPDLDADGLPNESDNCPYVTNPLQSDEDEDGIGDLCQGDLDGDQWRDPLDNCPEIPNRSQEDRDQDGLGDLCDEDLDGDEIPNRDDNCPLYANPNQEDLNGDGVGDLCSPENLWRCGECGVSGLVEDQVQCFERRCSPDASAIQQCVASANGRGVWVLQASCRSEIGGVIESNVCYLDKREPECIRLSFCGDHVIDEDETCDDGGRVSGDGCSATCQLERDSDLDGVNDTLDLCWGDDQSGDTDRDGVCDDRDQCPSADDALFAIRYRDLDGDGVTIASSEPRCPDDTEFRLDSPGQGATDSNDQDPTPRIVSLSYEAPPRDLNLGEVFTLTLTYDQPIIVNAEAGEIGIKLKIDTALGSIETYAVYQSHEGRQIEFTHRILRGYREIDGIELGGQLETLQPHVHLSATSDPQRSAERSSVHLEGTLPLRAIAPRVSAHPESGPILRPASYFTHITPGGDLYHFHLKGVSIYELDPNRPNDLESIPVNHVTLDDLEGEVFPRQVLQSGDLLIILFSAHPDPESSAPLKVNVYEISNPRRPQLLHRLSTGLVHPPRKIELVGSELVIFTQDTLSLYGADDLRAGTPHTTYENLSRTYPEVGSARDLCFDPVSNHLLIAQGAGGYMLTSLVNYPERALEVRQEPNLPTSACFYDGERLYRFDRLSFRTTIDQAARLDQIQEPLKIIDHDDYSLLRPQLNRDWLMLPFRENAAQLIDLRTPELTAYWITDIAGSTPLSATPYRSHIYTAGMSNGLGVHTYDPNREDEFATALSEPPVRLTEEIILVHGDYAYLRARRISRLIQVINISDPNQLRYEASLPLVWLLYSTDQIAIKDDLFAAYQDDGSIQFYDLNSIDSATHLPQRTFNYPDPAGEKINHIRFDKRRNYLYYSTLTGSVKALDLSNLEQIREVSRLSFGQTPIFSLFGDLEHLYCNYRAGSIEIIDISDPYQIAYLSSYRSFLLDRIVSKVWEADRTSWLLLDPEIPFVGRFEGQYLTEESINFARNPVSHLRALGGLFYSELTGSERGSQHLTWYGDCGGLQDCRRDFNHLLDVISSDHAVQRRGDRLYIASPQTGLSVYSINSLGYLSQDLSQDLNENPHPNDLR